MWSSEIKDWSVSILGLKKSIFRQKNSKYKKLLLRK